MKNKYLNNHTGLPAKRPINNLSVEVSRDSSEVAN